MLRGFAGVFLAVESWRGHREMIFWESSRVIPLSRCQWSFGCFFPFWNKGPHTNYSSTTVASVSVYVFSLIMKGLMESNTSKLDAWCTSKQNCSDPPPRTPKNNTSRSLGVGVFASCPRFQHFSPCLSGGMDEAGRDHFDKDFSGPLAAFFLDLCERIGTELFFGGLLQKKTINATVCQRCVCCWLATWNKKKFDSERLGCLILVPKSSGRSAWSFDESTWFPLVKTPGGIPKRYFIQKIPCNSSGSSNHC